MASGQRGTPPQNGGDGGEGRPQMAPEECWARPQNGGETPKFAGGAVRDPRPKMAERPHPNGEGPPPQKWLRDSQKWGATPAPKWLKDPPPKSGATPPQNEARPLTTPVAGGPAGHAGSCSLAVGCEQGMLGVVVWCRQSGREACWEGKGCSKPAAKAAGSCSFWTCGSRVCWEL